MIRHFLISYILAKRHIIGPIGPLFQDLALENLPLALMHFFLFERLLQILMLSSQLFPSNHGPKGFFNLLDVLENSFTPFSKKGVRNSSFLGGKADAQRSK